jgi:DNA-binding NarL/FixJ family response regulator
MPRLTPRHRQLLDLLAAGHTNAQIARRLGLAEGTVRTHLENLYRRLQVSSRAEAAARAVRDQDPYAGTGWSVEGYRQQKR